MSLFVGGPWPMGITVNKPGTTTEPLEPAPELVKVVVVSPANEEATLVAELVEDGVYFAEFAPLAEPGLWRAYAYAITGDFTQGVGESVERVKPAPTPA